MGFSVTSCSVVAGTNISEGTTSKMEAVSSCETLVSTYQLCDIRRAPVSVLFSLLSN